MGGTPIICLLGEVATVSESATFMFEVLEVAGAILAFSVCFMLTTWAFLIGSSALLMMVEEFKQWRNSRE